MNSSEKLIVKCPSGHVYEVSYGKFKAGRRCPYCSKRIKISKVDVVSYLAKNSYKLLSDFTNSNDPIIVECPNGHEWKIVYQKFKKGRRCSKCTNRFKKGKRLPVKWTEEMVRDEFAKSEFTLLSEYINSKEKLKMMCKEGHEFELTFNHFQRGIKCKECSIKKKVDAYRKVGQKVSTKLYRDAGFTLLENYRTSDYAHLIKCKEGHYTRKSISNLKSGTGCQGCLSSPYEAKIYCILKNIGYNIMHEYVHYELSNKRFDFAVMDESFKDILFLIEVDGEQHFRECSFGNKNSLLINQRRDKEKDNFCEKNNIKLIRIPYYKINDDKWLLNNLKTPNK